VDDYIEALDDNRRAIAEKLRDLLLAHVPGIEEKFSFKVPFYHYFGMFCYINVIKEGIALGFCRGKDLVLSFPQLEQGDRKMIALVKLSTPKDIVSKEVRELIITAAEWNREAKLMNKPMVNMPPRKKKATKKSLFKNKQSNSLKEKEGG
jgi:uncharacterized protein